MRSGPLGSRRRRPAPSRPRSAAPADAGPGRDGGRSRAAPLLPQLRRRAAQHRGHRGGRGAGPPAGLGRGGRGDPEPGRHGRRPAAAGRSGRASRRRPAERLPDPVPRGRRHPLSHRPATPARRPRRVPVQVGRRGRLRDPRDGHPGRTGDRAGRGDRHVAQRRAPARRHALRAAGDDPGIGQRPDQRAPDRGQPPLGRRAGHGPLRRGRRPVRRRQRDRRRDPGRGGRDRVRGDHRPRAAGHVRPRHPAPARRPARPDPHPLQHGTAGVRPVRHRPGHRPGGPPRRTRPARLGRRDPAVPAGGAPDDLGAGPGRRAAHAAPRRGRRAPDGPRRGGRRARRRGPGRRQRRHRQQGRHLPAGRPGGAPRHPVLRLRADELGRPRHGRRQRHRDRGAQGRGGPRVPRRAHRAAGHGRPQPGLRRHARRAHHRAS